MNKVFLFALFAGVVAADCSGDWGLQCAAVATPACDSSLDGTTVDSEFASAACKAYTTGKSATTDGCASYKECQDTAAQAAQEAKFKMFCPTDRARCTNMDAFCPAWAAQSPSQCSSNPDWMLSNCGASCCPICTGQNTVTPGKCPTTATLCAADSTVAGHTCGAWFTAGECTKNVAWMNTNCMQSCCPVCFLDSVGCATTKGKCSNAYADAIDLATMTVRTAADIAANTKKCVDWAANRECISNPKWMMENCGNECCPVCIPIAPVRAPVAAPGFPQQFPFQQPILPFQQPFPNFGGYGAFGGYNNVGLGGGFPYRG